MIGMIRAVVALSCILLNAGVCGISQKPAEYSTFDSGVVRAHEIKPHRRTVPLTGVGSGFHELHLTLIVSPAGEVSEATADGDSDILKFWPDLRAEVLRWKFIPFEENSKAVPAKVDEYLDLVPPERLPLIHMRAPAVRPDSNVIITLRRTVCYGRCPAYQVSVTTRGIVFEGDAFVAATGRHTDTADPHAVRELAKKFVAADFYSMNDEYRASVTDNPTYVLSISVDDHKKEIHDYVGSWVGMPAVITELEDAVDSFAQTERWIKGTESIAPGSKPE
jgi:hypothetical protein